MDPTDNIPENEALNADQAPPKQPPLAADPNVTKAKLPFIKFNNRPLRYVVDDCLKAARVANTPPTMFQQGNLLFRIRPDGDDIFLEQIGIDSLRGFLERAATFGKTYQKDGELKTSYWPLPHDYVRDILALPGWPEDVFLPIRGIARCPFFTADGLLVSEPGYHAISKIWLHLAHDLVIDPISPVPSSEVLASARHWIVDELLGDFPFQTDADRANAVAYVLTPFLREMITGPIPMGLLEAPAAGTGKGLLANAIAMPSLGRSLETIPQRNNDEEWRKAITAKLIELPLYILFDNLTGTLRSAALEAALTSENWSDRFLGETRMVRIKIRTIWLATANNLQIAGDLFRRVVWIRLDARMERPEDRKPSDFKHPELLSWAKANRAKLVWAALTIIQAWIARGKEPGTEIMGSYESWTTTLGGILKIIDVKGFLTNLEKNRVTSDDELVQLSNLVEAWKKRFKDEEVTVNEIFTMVAESDNLLPFVMEPETDHGRKVRLGRYLSRHRDRTVGEDKIMSLPPDKRSRCLRYRLVDKSANAAQLADPPAKSAQTTPSSRSTKKESPPTHRGRAAVRGDDVGDLETEGADDMEDAVHVRLVALCRSWWQCYGTKGIKPTALTSSLANLELIDADTPEELHWRCRELLPQMVGNTFEIYQVERAGYIDVGTFSECCYRLRVVEGQTPPPTNGEKGEANNG